MNILEVKEKLIQDLFENSILTQPSCDRIVTRQLSFILEELERQFDSDSSREWGSWEVSDMLHSMRRLIK